MTERTITFDDEDWQLVPRKPTPGMLAKALGATGAFLGLTGSKATINFKKMSIRYRAMLSAAPCPYELVRDFALNHECALAEATVMDMLAAYGAAHNNGSTGRHDPRDDFSPENDPFPSVDGEYTEGAKT